MIIILFAPVLIANSVTGVVGNDHNSVCASSDS